MNIYFAGSIKGGREDGKLYGALVTELKQYGTVLTEHVADPTLTIEGTQGMTHYEIWKMDTEWLKTSEIVIAEVTAPSLGVGYELARAQEWGKEVHCLFRPTGEKRLSSMIRGDAYYTVHEYTTIEEAKQIFRKIFSKKTP